MNVDCRVKSNICALLIIVNATLQLLMYWGLSTNWNVGALNLGFSNQGNSSILRVAPGASVSEWV